MNTPPIAGVWMKYANMNSDRSPPFVAMMTTVLAIVIRTGTQSAFCASAIHGSAARSARTLTAWIAARKAARSRCAAGAGRLRRPRGDGVGVGRRRLAASSRRRLVGLCARLGSGGAPRRGRSSWRGPRSLLRSVVGVGWCAHRSPTSVSAG